MTLYQALLLAITEGITEFLPVSSTGHMILISHLFGIAESDFTKSFEVIIQLGAILAVALLLYRRLRAHPGLIKIMCIAFVPSAIVGFVLYRLIKTFLLGNPFIVVTSLVLGGIILLYIHRMPNTKNKTIDTLTNKDACLIGICQSISVIPGVSRAAATIVGGLWMGMTKVEAVEFSFLLAVPTILGATILEVSQSTFLFSRRELTILLVGFLCAFITAAITINAFVSYTKKYSLKAFGLYRIILALCYAFLFLRPAS